MKKILLIGVMFLLLIGIVSGESAIYSGDSEGNIIKMDISTGELIWNNSYFYGDTVISIFSKNDYIIAGAADHVIKLNKDTGALIWSKATSYRAICVTADSNDLVYYADDELNTGNAPRLYILNADGTQNKTVLTNTAHLLQQTSNCFIENDILHVPFKNPSTTEDPSVIDRYYLNLTYIDSKRGNRVDLANGYIYSLYEGNILKFYTNYTLISNTSLTGDDGDFFRDFAVNVDDSFYTGSIETNDQLRHFNSDGSLDWNIQSGSIYNIVSDGYNAYAGYFGADETTQINSSGDVTWTNSNSTGHVGIVSLDFNTNCTYPNPPTAADCALLAVGFYAHTNNCDVWDIIDCQNAIIENPNATDTLAAYDDDGGLVYTNASYTYNQSNSINDTIGHDTCLSSSFLSEFYISGYNVEYTAIDCDALGWFGCINGECVNETYYNFTEEGILNGTIIPVSTITTTGFIQLTQNTTTSSTVTTDNLPEIFDNIQDNVKVIFALLIIAGLVVLTAQMGVRNPLVLTFVGIIGTVIMSVLGLITSSVLIIILASLTLLLFLGFTIFNKGE